jgi:hypothetical protein
MYCEGAAVTASANTTIANSIIWGNEYDNSHSPPDTIQADQINAPASATLANNIIQGWDGSLGGTNNSGEDPQFVDADGPDNMYGTEDDNARLSETSPAIDAGDNSFLPNDEFDIDVDSDTAEPLPLDLDNEARIVNEIVDLGAYEFDGKPECTADITPKGGDGEVNVDDLLLVINNWNATGDNPADVTGNGIVDVDDLLAVINAWGSCE